MALKLNADCVQTRGAVPRRLHQKLSQHPATVSDGGEIGSMLAKMC